jgi:Zn finger protein HypA/HybF involved in hydrogenase expression
MHELGITRNIVAIAGDAAACGSRQLMRLQGEELNIKSIELEAEVA